MTETEILFGLHPVSEALKAGKRRFFEIYIPDKRPSGRIEGMVEQARRLNIPVRQVPADRLDAMTNGRVHQGMGARVSPYPYTDISSMVQGPDPFLLILDSIVDPQNLGALIRTALCAGAGGIILPRDRSAAPSPVVSKASAGAMEHMPAAQVTNLTGAIGELKKKGMWISGLDIEGEQTIYASDLTGPLALVIGGEEKGIRPLVKKQCDFLVRIPQKGPLNSLNASAAGAVVMYEAFRQRMIERPSAGRPKQD
jgi:23S rRNA (guanosine2251-2'-O)-methyltransferase